MSNQDNISDDKKEKIIENTNEKGVKGWKSKLIWLILGLVGSWEFIFTPIYEKYIQDTMKKPDEIIREQGYNANLNGFEQAWKDKNIEIIEEFVKLKKEKPYIDIKLTPSFFKDEILERENSIPFLKQVLNKKKDLLKPEEICMPINNKLLDNIHQEWDKISDIRYFYMDLISQKEKQEILQVICTKELQEFSKFQNELDSKKEYFYQKLVNFKIEIQAELSFINNPKSMEEIIDKYFLGRCNFYAREVYVVQDIMYCQNIDENLYYKIKSIQEKFSKNTEFMEALKNYNTLK